MADVIIAGAGVGGIYLAGLLHEKGYKVTIIEKKPKESLGYDWHDDVDRETFIEAGISTDNLDFHLKENWSFIMQGSKIITKISIPEQKKDLSVHRRSLAKVLLSYAKDVQFFFSHSILKPIIDGSRMIGVSTDKGDFFADLVIDNCGYNSPLRSQLPDEALVDREHKETDVFHVYRAFANRKNEIEKAYHTNKAYLRHMGRKGISWAIDKENQVDILIGSTLGLTDKDISEAYDDLRKDNSIIGDNIFSEGKYVIPVRRPIEKMIWNNYVLLGDSAYMTIPMLGSGIRSSLICAKKLLETIEECSQIFTQENLWKYQVRCYRDFLYQHFAVDIMKRWLLKAKIADISYISNKGLINADEMAWVASGKPFELTPLAMLKKGIKGISNPRLLIELVGTLNKGKKAMSLALKIPNDYLENEYIIWEKKLKNLFPEN